VQAAEALGAEIGMAHHEGWQNSEFFCDAIRTGPAAMRAPLKAGFWTQVSGGDPQMEQAAGGEDRAQIGCGVERVPNTPSKIFPGFTPRG
jgi:hypothetical protein